jgi:hypothetical protein
VETAAVGKDSECLKASGVKFAKIKVGGAGIVRPKNGFYPQNISKNSHVYFLLKKDDFEPSGKSDWMQSYS